VVPILKKDQESKVEDYMGVTTIYKIYTIYASILAEKLRKEIECNGLDSTESNEL